MVIIGITGTNGAGKGAVVDYLIKKYNFKHKSASDFITKEIVKRSLEVNRDSMRIIGNDLRSKYGPSYIIKQLYNESINCKDNSIIESIRTIGEVEFLKKQKDFIFIGVDTDVSLRYERIKSRNSSKDKVSFEEFKIQEKKEMSNNDKDKQNIKQCLKMCNFVINNNSTLEELHNKIDLLLEEKNLL